MRLSPIENPKSLTLKLAYFISKKAFGKVIAPLRFIYSRSLPIMWTSVKILRTDNKLSLPKETRIFIRYYTSHFNDCKFCSNSIDFMAQKEKLAFEQWKDFMNFRNSPNFSKKQKALLAWLEEINTSKAASDENFLNLKKHFSEKEIVEITWINATENYFNLMAKPLGLQSDELKI